MRYKPSDRSAHCADHSVYPPARRVIPPKASDLFEISVDDVKAAARNKKDTPDVSRNAFFMCGMPGYRMGHEKTPSTFPEIFSGSSFFLHFRAAFRSWFIEFDAAEWDSQTHPSLQFKKIGKYRSVRIGMHYRALAVEIPEGLL